MKKNRLLAVLAIAMLFGRCASAANWTYDAAAKTISDGVWTLPVSAGEDGLTLTAVTASNATFPATPTALDLSKPVADMSGAPRKIVAISEKWAGVSSAGQTAVLSPGVGSLVFKTDQMADWSATPPSITEIGSILVHVKATKSGYEPAGGDVQVTVLPPKETDDPVAASLLDGRFERLSEGGEA